MNATPLTILNEDDKMFRDMTLDFAKQNIGPHVIEMDQQMKMRREIIDACFELGIMGIEIPEAYGGSGGTFFQSIVAIEALAMVDPSVAVLVDVQNTLVINAFLRWATEAQKEQYLPRLAKDWVGAYALSEPSSGSDAFALKCRAEQRGNDFVLNGSKLWITNGAEADLFVLMATVDPSAGYKGITAFLVERDFAGFSVGKKEDKLVIRSSSTCELILEDCVVPAANVIGEVGLEPLKGGFSRAISILTACPRLFR